MSQFDDLLTEIRDEFPLFRLAYKKDSWWAPLLGNSFMRSYLTIIGFTVWLPTNFDLLSETNKCIALRHERVHMRQMRKLGSVWLFWLLYLFLPLPFGLAWFRANFEKEAYQETLRSYRYYYGTIPGYLRPFFRKQFLGWFYGWMWPFPSVVDRWYDEVLNETSEPGPAVPAHKLSAREEHPPA